MRKSVTVIRDPENRSWAARGVAALALATGMIHAPSAMGVNTVYTWDGNATTAAPAGGSWGTATNWDPDTAPPNPGGIDVELAFGGSGATGYTSSNNLDDPFTLNRIVYTSTSTVASAISGNGLSFAINSDGDNPELIQNGSARLNVNAGLTVNVPLLIGGSGTGDVFLFGAPTGNGAITKRGAFTLALDNVATFTGTLTVDQGRVSVNGGANSIASYSGYTLNADTELVLGNNSPQNVVPNRLTDTGTLTMNGARLVFNGQAFKDAAAGSLAQETLGTLHFASGYSFNSIGQGSNSAGSQLDTTVARSAGATASWRGSSFGGPTGTRRVIFDNAAGFLVGGGGAAGTTNISILPWMVAESNNGFAANPSSFATHDANGLRSLNTSTEYTNNINTAAATDNVSTANVGITVDKAINSLRVNGGAGNIASGGVGRILTVTSGGVIFANNNNTIGTGAGPAGTLDFGSAEGIIFTLGSNTNTIRSAITGNAGLTKGGTGTLILSGDNGYSGTTYAGGGTLQVGEGAMGSGATLQTAADLGSGDVFVAQGATLAIREGVLNAIADSATVSLDASGVVFGRVNLDTGIDELIAALSLDGALFTAAGTYGSSDSGADFQFNDYFTGAGVLRIVPEPASLALITMGGVALLGARRGRDA